ncbi:MAG TPA: tetratricopeptide repeat protein [Thermoanaerobaculia bacterium]|nr:tetratricopeptide repeat protein [Thermoanaerobaculia bacterium]
MRLNTALMGLLLAVSDPLAATTVKGVILENEMGGRAIANVQVSAIGASPVSSNSDGTFVLDFPKKQPGEKVRLIVVRSGMVVVNDFELRFTLPKTADADLLILLLCREDERQEMVRRYYRLDSFDPIEQRYQKQLADLQSENQATEAAKEQLRIERDRAMAAEQRAAEKLARVKTEEVGDFLHSSYPPVYRSDAPKALNSLGSRYRRQNRMQEAREKYEEALKISRELAQHDSAIYLPDVEETLNNLGNLFSDQNRIQEAREKYEEALKISRNLAEENPVIYLPCVASTLDNLGTLLRKENRVEEACTFFHEALGSYRKLAQLNPDTYQPHVAEMLNKLGILNHYQNRIREAREDLREALAIYEALARKSPGQYAQEVESIYQEALKISRKLAQQNPATYLPDVTELLTRLGNLLSDQNRMQEAWEAYSEALDNGCRLAQRYPAMPKVAMMLIDLGILNYDQGRMGEARKAFNCALAIYETLAMENPEQYGKEVESTRRLLEDKGDRRKP